MDQEADSQKSADIKTMKLYSHVSRIYNELKALGYGNNDPLRLDDVNKFDQYHYYGTAAIDQGIQKLGIKSDHCVLDVGSGLGGPARYLANTAGCQVTAVELQADLDKTSRDLTTRCSLQDKVIHTCGDFLSMDFGDNKFDFIVSWLVFLHISDKDKVFSKCNKVLAKSGQMYIADYFQRNSFTAEEATLLRDDLYCERLPTREQYIGSLERNGFTNIQFEDVTGSYADFVHARLEHHMTDRDRYVSVHGEQIYQEQLHFFQVIDRIYQGGNIGGCHVIARLPGLNNNE